MASKPKDDEEQPVEVKAHDYDLAMKIVKQDILPANSKSGEYAQEASTAYKAIKKQAHLQPGSVKAAIQIADKEAAKRDDYLRGLAEMVNRLTGEKLLTFHGTDLVDQAEGVGSERKKPFLATVGGDDFEEASAEELAGQASRPSTEAAQAEADAEAEKPKANRAKAGSAPTFGELGKKPEEAVK